MTLVAAENLYGQSDRWIETVTGRRFYFEAPTFDLNEIAAATSKICRFTGHCSSFYSVAEHSVLVAQLMEYLDLGNPMEGLLHDGAEAYLADVASPVKSMLPDYKALDKKLDAALRKQFNLPPEKTPGCTRADWLALVIEAEQLIPSRAADWFVPDDIRQQAKKLLEDDNFPEAALVCYYPDSAHEVFLAVYHSYRMDAAA